jgi:hypothetical protein
VAIYSWYDLSWRERRAVVRLARTGRRHPDATVARVAEEWARETLGTDGNDRGGIGSMLLRTLLGEGEAVREYRAAKRIMRVASADRRPGGAGPARSR